MKENDFKNGSRDMNNNVRNARQQENRPEGRPVQVNGQQPQQPQQQNRQYRNEGFRRDGQGYKSYNRDNRENRENRDNRENRESGYNRDSGFRSYNTQSNTIRRVKSEETIDDIRADLARIEKEIDLEIKQIASLRLGV